MWQSNAELRDFNAQFPISCYILYLYVLFLLYTFEISHFGFLSTFFFLHVLPDYGDDTTLNPEPKYQLNKCPCYFFQNLFRHESAAKGWELLGVPLYFLASSVFILHNKIHSAYWTNAIDLAQNDVDIQLSFLCQSTI